MPPSVEVIVPAVREPSALLESLSLGRRKPDLVTIVSNEVDHVETFGLPVRIIRFTSELYAYGDNDVVLRRNLGIWLAEHDWLVFQDDDQIAPAGMLESSVERLAADDLFRGHHRFIDFEQIGLHALLEMPPERGREREHPPNYLHGHWSCYAGMFGAHREALLELGGFDMLFLGRHGSEDQSLGRRSLLRRGEGRVFIWEPPFAWHPLKSPPLPKRRPTNTCTSHELERRKLAGASFMQCSRCPFRRAIDGTDLFADRVIMPFDLSAVSTREET